MIKKMTFDEALQDVDDLMGLMDINEKLGLEVARYSDGSYSVEMTAPLEPETFCDKVGNAFEKAGNHLYCDAWRFEDLNENEYAVTGVVELCYVKEKQINEQTRINEKFRLFDMLGMGLHGEYSYIEFDPTQRPTYTDNYDVVVVSFEIGKKLTKD